MELFIVIAIVGAAAVLAARSFYRTMAGRNKGCGCGTNCRNCVCKDLA